MTKTAPQRRSQIARVMDFFRNGSRDEIMAVILLLAKEDTIGDYGIHFDALDSLKQPKRRRRRLNGADVNSSANSQPERAEGAGA